MHCRSTIRIQRFQVDSQLTQQAYNIRLPASCSLHQRRFTSTLTLPKQESYDLYISQIYCMQQRGSTSLVLAVDLRTFLKQDLYDLFTLQMYCTPQRGETTIVRDLGVRTLLKQDRYDRYILPVYCTSQRGCTGVALAVDVRTLPKQ